MNCNCTWTEAILAIVIIVFAFWQTTYSLWITVIAAVVLLLHAFMCKKCRACKNCEMEMGRSAAKSGRSKSRRRR